MKNLAILICGALFGAGVTVSGMVNPMRVLNFMDIFGAFDPTLIFVMGAGLLVNLIGYRLVFRRNAPLFESGFNLPATSLIDTRLIGGATLFGLGWGLSGFCPGPAVASLVFGYSESILFVIAMAIGILLGRTILNAKPVAQEAG
jgi:uncharacterized protein